MPRTIRRFSQTLILSAIALLNLIYWQPVYGQTSSAADTQVTRVAGTIKSVQGNTITVVPDSGLQTVAEVSPSTRILRVAPGQKDLSSATAIQLQDLQPGDRVLVRGQAGSNGSISALAVIVMKQSDVKAKHQEEQQEWSKHGVAGLVDSVDVAGNTIVVTSGGLGQTKKVTVKVSSHTVLRRYAPDSVKFEDAKPAPLDQIKPADQLRVRGTKSPDGGEMVADEIVSGTFRNIAGTIASVDVPGDSVTVKDAIGKNTVTVKVTPDSLMKKLPTEMAQRIAMRLKALAGGEQGSAPERLTSTGAAGRPPGGAPGQRGPGGGQGERGNGPPDFDRMLSRVPNSTLAELQKGDAVIILASPDGGEGSVTAIKLISGVEPILTSASSKSASAILSPWTLGSGGAEGENGP